MYFMINFLQTLKENVFLLIRCQIDLSNPFLSVSYNEWVGLSKTAIYGVTR